MKLGFLRKACAVSFFFLSIVSVNGQVTSVGSGDWRIDAATVWDTGLAPSGSDDVIISNGTTVTVSTTEAVDLITIQSGILDITGRLDCSSGVAIDALTSNVNCGLVLDGPNSILNIYNSDFNFNKNVPSQLAGNVTKQRVEIDSGRIVIYNGDFNVTYTAGGGESTPEILMRGTGKIDLTQGATFMGDFNMTYLGAAGDVTVLEALLGDSSSIIANDINLIMSGADDTATGDIDFETRDTTNIVTVKDMGVGGNFTAVKNSGRGNIDVLNGRVSQNDSCTWSIAGNMELTNNGSSTTGGNSGRVQYGQYSIGTTTISDTLSLSALSNNEADEDVNFSVFDGTMKIEDLFKIINDNSAFNPKVNIQLGNNTGNTSAIVGTDSISARLFDSGGTSQIVFDLYERSVLYDSGGLNVQIKETNSGSVNFDMTLNDTTSMTVEGDVIFDVDDGGTDEINNPKSRIWLTDTSTFTLEGNFSFNSTDSDRPSALQLTQKSHFILHGDFTFEDSTIPDSLIMASTSTIEFASSAEQQQIPHRDSFTYGRVVINNTSPDGVILFGEPSDKVIFEGPLAMENGVLFTNDLMLILNDTASSSSTSTFVDGAIHKPLFGLKTDNSMLFPLGDADAGVRGLIETSFPSGFDSNDTVAIEYIHSDPLYRNYGTLAAASAIEYWLIDVHEEGSSQIMNIRLLWDDGDVSQVPPDPADITVAYVDLSDTWIDLGNSANAINASSPFNGFVSANTGVINKDIFDNPNPTIISFGSTVAGVLPVELVGFEVRSANERALLSWSTASELNNDYFQIERSGDGFNFVPIGKVNGVGTTNAWQEYEFVDNYPLLPVSYYRLKQVDYDGTTSYSDIKYLSFSQEHLSSAIKIAPNPAVHRIATLQVDIDPVHVRESYSLQLLDLSGKVIFESLNIPSNQQSIPLDLSQVQVSSILLVKITTDLGKIYQTKLLTGK